MKYILLFLFSFNLFADVNSELAQIRASIGPDNNQYRLLWVRHCNGPKPVPPLADMHTGILTTDNDLRQCFLDNLTAFHSLKAANQATRDARQAAHQARKDACDNMNGRTEAQIQAVIDNVTTDPVTDPHRVALKDLLMDMINCNK